MSFIRSILCLSLTIIVFSNCEDTQSKKNKQHIKTVNTNDHIKVKNTTSDTINEQKSSSKKEDLAQEPFKLSNQNLREFMDTYGKENPETLVKLKTIYGDIHIKLYKETPLHRANFIYLVKQKYFDETFFYRVAKGFVIQGGNSDRQEMANKRFEIGEYTIPQEQVKRLKHTRGSVALSKQWEHNPSNRSTPFEFFIVIAKNGAPHLDGEHTIFGKVTKGMNVADKIANVPVDSSEWPKKNIFITAEIIR